MSRLAHEIKITVTKHNRENNGYEPLEDGGVAEAVLGPRRVGEEGGGGAVLGTDAAFSVPATAGVLAALQTTAVPVLEQ